MSTAPILTVSLNAAVDVVYTIDRFAPDTINTATDVQRMAGGKANNVARVLASLGQRVIATGFTGGAAGRFIVDDLTRRRIVADFEESGGENRTCTTIIDPTSKTVTELRERGPVLTPADAERFLARFRRLVGGAGLVIISGSLPPGIAADFYRELVSEAWRAGQVRTLLDACGEPLAAALSAQPYFVKPNLDELQEWAGAALPTDHHILLAARKLLKAGPLLVGVSLGARGLLLVSESADWWATPPAVEPLNTVGSGDSLVAGFATGLLTGLDADGILRLAVACGTANALTRAVAEVRPEDVEQLRGRVQVRKVR
ncbi:MAG: tagatose-6-phosphate kinase [Symbiobacteriaceae bacterium]|jgi:1-phosphofructokinase family hexose kinase|nr:tagatose-6-phosphate kinase [Symbiobacteriaceae bacterium]